MSVRKLKRPSSGRRSIKQDTFSTFVSCTRLRHIQSIIQNEKNKSDGILAILGIDSRYHEGSRELVYYLLFGMFESRRSEIENSGYAEEIIDDLMFLVKEDSIHVYCNPINYPFILPYVGCWPNLRIHCLKEKDYSDDELAEEFKIQSFIRMVDGCKSIGIPFSSSGHSHVFDKMMIEKWPIVQAYGLDEYGGRGFFTMKHEIVDISEEVTRTYSLMDPVGLEALVTEHLPLFERQLNTMVRTLDSETPEGLLKVTQKKACEPLKSYFSHGRVGQGRQMVRHPYVLFGTETRKQSLLKAATTGSMNEGYTLQDTGLQGKLASHMVCQAVSPRGPLTCARTYFFSSGQMPYPDELVQLAQQLERAVGLITKVRRRFATFVTHLAPNQRNVLHNGYLTENLKQLHSNNADVKLLNVLYQMTIDALLSGLVVYATSLSQSQTEKHVLSHLQEAAEDRHLQISKNFLKNRENVELKIEAYDNHGNRVPLEDGNSIPLIKTATLSLYDIPSTEYPGQTIGSVVFAESFLESNIPVTNNEPSGNCDASLTVLTSHVPRYATWMAEESDVQVKSEIDTFLTSSDSELFGCLLLKGETADILTENCVSSKQEGSLYIYEGGLIFSPTRGDVIVVPHTEIEDVEFYDGDSPSNACLLVVNYDVKLRPYLPDWLLAQSQSFMIALAPRSKGTKVFYSEVLPLWRKEGEKISLQHLEKLKPEVETIYTFLQLQYSSTSVQNNSASPLKKALTLLPDLHGFVDHFTVSSVGRVPVTKSDLAILLQQPPEVLEEKDAEEIIITIVSGIPGSYKESLCNVISSMVKDQSRWLVFRQPVENTDAFNPESLQHSLTAALQAQKRKRPGVARKQLRTLVCTPGFTNVLDMVQAIVCHPNPDVAKHLKIGAVTVCVDPLNVYMADRYTFPKLLDQCSQGFVNNIMFTSSTEPKNPDLASIQELIRAANSDVAFLLANKGESLRSQDLDMVLSETAFTSSTMQRWRHLSCPGWSTLQYRMSPDYPKMEAVCLRFTLPLERMRFVTQLKGLKNSLQKYPFAGNVYFIKGKVRFTGNQKMYEIEYCTNTGIFRSTPTDIQPTPPSAPGTHMTNGSPHNGHEHCVVFTGCGLMDEGLKDWLTACGKQKPAMMEQKDKQNLTKDELKKIHTEHHLDPLPEGWFYNGIQFVGFGGEKSDHHPEMDTFVSEYLAMRNQEIDAYNRKIEAEEYPDMFA